MRIHKYILALDFDYTLTIGEHVSRTWADRLAKKLNRLRDMFPLEIFILSVANISHILFSVMNSHSTQLLETFNSMEIVSYDSDNIYRLEHERGETRKQREAMIKKIVPPNYVRNIDPIIAYKKTNYLLRKSKQENIPHSHVFFLDDNNLNIHFAKYHGFQTFLVDNQHKDKNIFTQLDKVRDILKNV